MFALAPWSLARRAAHGRRAVLLLVLAALLYGIGMHAARACAPAAAAAVHHSAIAAGNPCHGEIDVAQAACEALCNTDTQSGRASPSFDLPAAAPVRLEVCDVTGRLVRTLLQKDLEPGSYAVPWNGLDGRGLALESGVYFTLLQAGGERATQRMMLLK